MPHFFKGDVLVMFQRPGEMMAVPTTPRCQQSTWVHMVSAYLGHLSTPPRLCLLGYAVGGARPARSWAAHRSASDGLRCKSRRSVDRVGGTSCRRRRGQRSVGPAAGAALGVKDGTAGNVRSRNRSATAAPKRAKGSAPASPAIIRHLAGCAAHKRRQHGHDRRAGQQHRLVRILVSAHVHSDQLPGLDRKAAAA